MIWDRLEFFDRDEFDQPDQMSEALLMRLDKARRLARVPFKITSDWRELTDGGSAHEHGLAVDIQAHDSKTRMTVVTSCLEYFDRIGVYDRHVHVDVGNLVDPRKWVPDVMWVGKSR